MVVYKETDTGERKRERARERDRERGRERERLDGQKQGRDRAGQKEEDIWQFV